METPATQNASTTRLSQELLIHVLIILVYVLLESHFATSFEFSEKGQLNFTQKSLTTPTLIAFLIATVCSLVIGKWATIWISRMIKTHLSENWLLKFDDDSLLGNFGSTVFVLILAIFQGGRFFCDFYVFEPNMPALFSPTSYCYQMTYTAGAVIAGLAMGLLLCLYLRVIQVEKEMSTKIMVMRITKQQWSFGVILLSLVVAYLTFKAFYQLLTLGR